MTASAPSMVQGRGREYLNKSMAFARGAPAIADSQF